MVQYDIAWPACDSERTARWGEASTEMRSALQMLEKLSSAPTTEQKSIKKVTYKKKNNNNSKKFVYGTGTYYLTKEKENV